MDLAPRVYPPCACSARNMRAAISKVNSRWFVLKLSGMSTIMREWAALHCIGHLPLRDVLLSAKVRWCSARPAPACGLQTCPGQGL